MKSLAMFNDEFSDNHQLRFGETSSLPVAVNNHDLYFVVLHRSTLKPCSYNSDIRGLNNLHRALTCYEGEPEDLLITCVWRGHYQAHTFVCEIEVIKEKITNALGGNLCDELPVGLSY